MVAATVPTADRDGRTTVERGTNALRALVCTKRKPHHHRHHRFCLSSLELPEEASYTRSHRVGRSPPTYSGSFSAFFFARKFQPFIVRLSTFFCRIVRVHTLRCILRSTLSTCELRRDSCPRKHSLLGDLRVERTATRSSRIPIPQPQLQVFRIVKLVLSVVVTHTCRPSIIQKTARLLACSFLIGAMYCT